MIIDDNKQVISEFVCNGKIIVVVKVGKNMHVMPKSDCKFKFVEKHQ